MAGLKRSKTRVKGFNDSEMDFQLLRQLGSVVYGGASSGECFYAASRIEDGIPESWVMQYEKLAEKEETDAAERLKKGFVISARDQYLKACNSYRAAEYYSPCHAEKHRALGLRSRECFLEAMKCSAHTFEEIMLPYKDIVLPVYFMKPDENDIERPTLIILSGFDGTREEEYIARGRAGLERGFNIVLFSGPGQMDTLRFSPDSGFEPDYENPAKAVLDWCWGRQDVRKDKICMMGISFGGYFAVRAAAFDGRIKALIANSPITDLHAYMVAFVGEDSADMKDEENFRLSDIPDIPDSILPVQAKEMSANLIRRFKQDSFRDVFIYLKRFANSEYLHNIHCPCLALVGEGEGGEPAVQFREFCEKVSGSVTEYSFSQSEGADSHCQVGNLSFSAAVAYDWLMSVFGNASR